MEGRRNKKRKKDRKEEGIQGERRKEKRRRKKKKRSSAGFKLVRLVLLFILSVEREFGWKDWFHFSPFLSHTLHCSVFSLVPQGPFAPH